MGEGKADNVYLVEVSVLAKRIVRVAAPDHREAERMALCDAEAAAGAEQMRLRGWDETVEVSCVGNALPGDHEVFGEAELSAAQPPMCFRVVDAATGRAPDLAKIAFSEDWAQNLMHCDMDGFALDEDGCLLVLDECGHYSYAPEGRFEVVLGSGK